MTAMAELEREIEAQAYHFEEYMPKRPNRGRAYDPRPLAYLNRNRTLSLNPAALALIGYPDWVAILWDAERRTVALRPMRAQQAKTYRVGYLKPQAPQEAVAQVTATGFFRAINVARGEHAFDVRVHDGLLIFGPVPEWQS